MLLVSSSLAPVFIEEAGATFPALVRLTPGAVAVGRALVVGGVKREADDGA